MDSSKISALISVIERFDSNNIDIPGYQRSDVAWSSDIKLRSRLVESILLGLPIPPIWLVGNLFGQSELVDGLQRLTSLSSFRKNEFKLTGLEDFTGINGLTYKDLSVELREVFDNFPISYYSLRWDTDTWGRSIGQHMFKRLNAGRSLSAAENLHGRMYGKGVLRVGELSTIVESFVPKDRWETLKIRSNHETYTMSCVIGLLMELRQSETKEMWLLDTPMKKFGNNPQEKARECVIEWLNKLTDSDFAAIKQDFQDTLCKLSACFDKQNILGKLSGKSQRFNHSIAILQFSMVKAVNRPLSWWGMNKTNIRAIQKEIEDSIHPDRNKFQCCYEQVVNLLKKLPESPVTNSLFL
jgi:hypothetical protein